MNREFIHRLTENVEQNLANENFGPEELADKIGMSHSGLHRKLKEISNQSISQFIREIRLNKAKDLLLKEEITVSEIAYKVGFGSSTYFNKCFHEYFGVAPGEFKKQELEKKLESEPENLLSKKKIQRVFLFVVAPILIIASVFLFLKEKYSFFKKELPIEKSMALLPVNYLGDPEFKYQAEGTWEEIKNNLAQIKDLRVLDRSSVEPYRFSTKTEKEIGKKLNVGALLKITFQRENENIVLFVNLINASDGTILFSEKYPGTGVGIFSMQSKIAQTIASELHAQLTPEEKQRIEKIPTISLTAYDFYQKGREELWEFEADNSKREALENAEKHFQKALDYDSLFALAYTGLAQVYRDKNYYKEYFTEDFLDSVIFLTNRAVELDNQLAEAYNLRGIYYFDKGNFEQALKELDTALKYNPNLWEAFFFKGRLYRFESKEPEQTIYNFHRALLLHRGSSLPLLYTSIAQAYLYAGFTEQAEYYYKQAFSLNQDSAKYFNSMADIENNNRNYKESIEFGIKAIQYGSTTTETLNLLGFNYSMVNNPKESLKYYKKMLELLQLQNTLNVNNMHRVGYAYFKNGFKNEASFYFNEQIKFCKESIEFGRSYSSGFWAYYDLAAVYAFLGEKEKALENLRIFNQRQNLNIVCFRLIKDDPLLNNLRNEPEFQQIEKDIETKYLSEHERVRKWLEEQELL